MKDLMEPFPMEWGAQEAYFLKGMDTIEAGSSDLVTE
jgi:hypothetical protein